MDLPTLNTIRVMHTELGVLNRTVVGLDLAYAHEANPDAVRATQTDASPAGVARVPFGPHALLICI